MTGKVKRAIAEAMVGRGLVAEPYTMPEKINGKKPKLVSVKENLVRIQEHDPIDFLLRLMAGEPMKYHHIDEAGRKVTEYAPVNPKDRVRIAMYLTGKLLPQMHIVKDMNGEDSDDVDGFDALVDEAIGRGKRKQIEGSAEALGKKSN